MTAAGLDAAATGLPVAAALPELRAALAAHGAAVLEAPPGAGKTTLVPLALLPEPWLAGGTILVLEPRRVAARAAARRMAHLLGQEVGGTVGYAVRFERRCGPATRVEVVTEGLLTRRIQRDPGLEGVGLVVFDEFHERSLDADLGLALCLDAKAALRPDLALLVMSATLDGDAAAGLLGGAPVIRSPGRAYPVRTLFRPPAAGTSLEDAVAEAALEALAAAADGDVLAFLPGAREIRRTAERLARRLDPARAVALPLLGDLPAAEQDRALARDPAGRRKVVLATNLAETSLTIDGVRAVVDGGRARRPAFSPRTGMDRLETVRVSRASADQRRGRAGRQGPGLCLRLWSEAEDRTLRAFDPPEIARADLAPLALELAAWGSPDPAALAWPTPPPEGAWAQGLRTLRELGAIDAAGRVTPHGRRMAELPMHPRLAHMLLAAGPLGIAPTALAVAALLGGRDPWRAAGPRDPDMADRLDRWRRGDPSADPHALRELGRVRGQLARLVRGAAGEPVPADAGTALALAYPDRLAQARGGAPGTFRLAGGRGARLEPAHHPLARAEFLAIADLDDTGADASIRLAAELPAARVPQLFGGRIETVEEAAWDEGARAVRAERTDRLGALVLKVRPWPDPPPEAVARALAAGLKGLDRLPWSPGAAQLRARLALLHRRSPEAWPAVDDAALLARLADWLGPELAAGARSLADLARADLGAALLRLAPPGARRELDRLFPPAIELPTGRRAAVDYAADPPVLAVRLQELFGLDRHLAILDGALPLAVHLLSPAGRPVQVTRDLPGFWRGSYALVRKELRGRYPKHDWPEDPLAARPQAGARRRG